MSQNADITFTGSAGSPEVLASQKENSKGAVQKLCETLELMQNVTGKLLYAVFSLIGVALTGWAINTLVATDTEALRQPSLLIVGLSIMVIGLMAQVALMKNLPHLLLVINAMNFVLLVVLCIAIVMGSIVSFDVKDPVDQSLTQGWPHIRGTLYKEFCPAHVAHGLCINMTDATVNGTAIVDTKVCDTFCKKEVSVVFKSHQRTFQMVVNTLAIFLFIIYAVSIHIQFQLRRRREDTLGTAERFAMMANAIIALLGLMLVYTGASIKSPAGIPHAADLKEWTWAADSVFTLGCTCTGTGLFSILAICTGRRGIMGPVYTMCCWMVAFLGQSMAFIALFAALTDDVIVRVNTAFKVHWTKIRDSFENSHPDMFQRLCPVGVNSTSADLTITTQAGLDCMTKIKNEIKGSQKNIGVFTIVVFLYLWVLIWFTFRNVKIQLAQKHRMLESYSSEEEDESDLVEPARESQMEDLRVDANLLP